MKKDMMWGARWSDEREEMMDWRVLKVEKEKMK